MNAFVLCTGRCGSKTFARAAMHCTNYTVAHESVELRHALSYPDGHIEVNNRLAWFLGLLLKKFPDALYVHLKRDPTACARSYAPRRRAEFALMNAWRKAIRMGWYPNRGWDEEREPVVDALEMVEAINANIELGLKTLPPEQKMTVNIEEPHDFESFWRWAGLQGDLGAARQTFCRVFDRSRR